MKIRIQDNSVRLRLTLKEVEQFAGEGAIHRRTQIVGNTGLGPSFEYSLRFDESLDESNVVIGPDGIAVLLARGDREQLLRPDQEGVYIRREWSAPGGTTHRFMAMVEKDRPGSTCIKKEQWIYDAPPHGPVETRPIPGRAGS